MCFYLLRYYGEYQSDTTVTQTAMMVEKLLTHRSTYKALVTKSFRTLSCLIKESDFNLIQNHGVMMKAWFHNFDDVCESYLEMLTDETDITAAESYYDVVYDDYMDQLDSLNYAMDSFTMQAPAVVQKTDSNTTLSTMSPIINLPKMAREQETKSPTQPVQSVVQNNETVPMNTHNCTCQPLHSQQVQEIMSIELVHLSTCVHDRTAPNCDQSLLDLHIDVQLQPQVSIAAITKEQQPDLFDIKPPVTIQCSLVSLDPHIDQINLHVQSPTSCAQYSHTHHATIHHASIVPSLIQLANSRSTDHHVLNTPPQHPLKLKVSQTPRKVKEYRNSSASVL